MRITSILSRAFLVGILLSTVWLLAQPINREASLVMANPKLTPEEERIIVHKGTEPPFTGKYLDHHEDGTYTCKRCGAPLYRSADKFNSGCGWPSFDDEIEGAIKRQPDPDGRRTEILCAACDAHLGHVFKGEKMTPKDTRHCVNSLSIGFTPTVDEKATPPETAYFAGGCFWGVEHLLEQQEGVLQARSGYMGGHVETPSYKQVCEGLTGHVETVEVVFDPRKISYESLAKLFFEIHDPTQKMRQGPDVGEQYRSVVFVTNEIQKATAQGLIDTLKAKGLDVATSLEPAATFWPAEDYHQDYYKKTGKAPYCHHRVKRFEK